MVKPCFIWKNSKNVYHVMDIPGNCYGRGNTPKTAVESAIRNGVAECEIDMGDLNELNLSSQMESVLDG